MASDFQAKVAGRPDMRQPPVKENDPRSLAAARAAEIRGHIGNMDEGTDEFYVSPDVIPDGWTYEWKRHTIYNQEDPAYQVQLKRMGWEPVPLSRHPEMMPGSWQGKVIERKGCILMERPAEITQEMRNIELRRARQQVRVKEEQLAAAPPGQFDRNNKDAPLAKIKKNYEPMEVPE